MPDELRIRYSFGTSQGWHALCKLSKADRSVTLDVVKKPLWVDAKAYTTIEGVRNADARLVAPVVDGLPEELPLSSGPTTLSIETARGSSTEYLDSSSPVDDMRTSIAGPTTT